MLHGLRCAHLVRRFADDHSQFALVVHEAHAGWPPRLAAMTDHGARPFEEHQRLVFGGDGELFRQLLDVVAVVQAQRNDGAHLERRQPHHVSVGQHAAVRKLNAALVRIRGVNRPAVGNARSFHAASCTVAAAITVAVSANARDLGANALPRARQRRAVRHTEHQHITGCQRHEVGHVREQARDRANHVRCAGLLHQRAIDRDRDGEVVGRFSLGGRNHRGPMAHEPSRALTRTDGR